MNDLSTVRETEDARLHPDKPTTGSRIDFRLALRIAGAVLVVATASVQFYDILRRLDIVVETAQQRLLTMRD